MIDPRDKIGAALAANNLGYIDNLCRLAIQRGAQDPELWIALGRVADKLGARAHAVDLYETAVRRGAGPNIVGDSIEVAREAASKAPHQVAEREKYLVIREWGHGFWSDVFHVVTLLMVAEWTNRIPIVYWGANSRFTNDPNRDAFSTFFNPIGLDHLADANRSGQSVYPPRWRPGALTEQRRHRGVPLFVSDYGPGLLFRDETVVVADIYTWLAELLPWTEEKKLDPLEPQTAWSLFRRVVRKYLRPLPAVVAAADAAWSALAMRGPTLAVHVRGSDKEWEVAGLSQAHRILELEAGAWLGHSPETQILLLTDSETVLQSWLSRHGNRLHSTTVTRTADKIGVHHHNYPDRYRLGVEVLVDTLLACRCDRFIGMPTSNVATAIACLKDWPEGTMRLIGSAPLFARHYSVYDPDWQRRSREIAGRLNATDKSGK